MSAGKAVSLKTVSLVAGLVLIAVCVVLLVTPVRTGAGDECGSIVGDAGLSDERTYLDLLTRTASDFLCKRPLRQRFTASVATGIVGVVLVAVGLVVGTSTAASKVNAPSGDSVNGAPTAQPPQTLADQLAEIARLHLAGQLSDAEYELAKARLLNSDG